MKSNILKNVSLFPRHLRTTFQKKKKMEIEHIPFLTARKCETKKKKKKQPENARA
jgi:hypothetical protein